MITPYNFSVFDTMTWVLNIEALFIFVICCKDFRLVRKFEKSKWFLNDGDGRAVPVPVVGNIQLVLNSNIIILDDCHNYPPFFMNVIFIGLLAKDSYNFLIKN